MSNENTTTGVPTSAPKVPTPVKVKADKAPKVVVVKAAATPPPPAATSEPFSLDRLVKDAVKAAAPKVRESVIKTLADKELEKRLQAIMKGITEIETLRIEIKQVKPDTEQMDEEGKLRKFYNKDTMEKLNQKKQRLEKLEGAIASALREEEPDFGPILNTIK